MSTKRTTTAMSATGTSWLALVTLCLAGCSAAEVVGPRGVGVPDAAPFVPQFDGGVAYDMGASDLGGQRPTDSQPGRCDDQRVAGDIGKHYRRLGGCLSVLGAPVSGEVKTPDGVGRYVVFEKGSIYWTPKTGAHAVLGAIRDKWAKTGWEKGILGYPIMDQRQTPDTFGRFSRFQRGSIYWTPQTGAHEVHGAIHDTWADLDWEKGFLGYPVSDEYDVSVGRRSDFQGGSITWDATVGRMIVSKKSR